MFPGFNTSRLCDLLNNKTIDARVVDIIDGDTIILVFKFLSTFIKMNVRIYGIDSCEKLGTNKDLGQKATAFAYMFFANFEGSRNQLRDCLDKNEIIVDAQLLGLDKFGRLIAIIKKNGKDYANEVLRAKLAYNYFGGTKLSEDDQLKLMSNVIGT